MERKTKMGLYMEGGRGNAMMNGKNDGNRIVHGRRKRERGNEYEVWKWYCKWEEEEEMGR